MWGNHVEMVGNVTRDPELRFAQSGVAICQFGMAWNKRVKDGDDIAHFFDVVAFRQLAENCAESLKKGMRVVVIGELQQRSWQTDTGDKRSKVEILADEISPSLRWASAAVTRNEYSGGRGGDPGPSVPGEAVSQPAAQPAAQPVSQPASVDDEPF